MTTFTQLAGGAPYRAHWASESDAHLAACRQELLDNILGAALVDPGDEQWARELVADITDELEVRRPAWRLRAPAGCIPPAWEEQAS